MNPSPERDPLETLQAVQFDFDRASLLSHFGGDDVEIRYGHIDVFATGELFPYLGVDASIKRIETLTSKGSLLDLAKKESEIESKEVMCLQNDGMRVGLEVAGQNLVEVEMSFSGTMGLEFATGLLAASMDTFKVKIDTGKDNPPRVGVRVWMFFFDAEINPALSASLKTALALSRKRIIEVPFPTKAKG